MKKAKISERMAVLIRVTIVCIVVVNLFTICTVRKMNWNSFNNSCIAHIERANDATTIDLKRKELKKAIDFLEELGLDGNIDPKRGDKEQEYQKWFLKLKLEYEKLDDIQLDEILNNIPEDIDNYTKNDKMFYWEFATFVITASVIFYYIETLFKESGT